MKPESVLAERPTIDLATVKSTLIDGDLSKLNEGQLLNYYSAVCESIGLNPLTKPFAFIRLNGKLVLYALKDCTEQLRKLHGVSITEVTSERLDDVFVVTAKASDRSGRTDAATGAVAIGNIKGEALANSLMKAETKAKRRVTLSICGLGMLDETEVETIQQPLFVEAPTVPTGVHRVPLPDNHVYILKSEVREWGGEVTVVDAAGEEHTYATPERRCAELCEQIVQETPPVPVRLELVKGRRDGKIKIKAVHRWIKPEENAAIDAEIAAKEVEVELPL